MIKIPKWLLPTLLICGIIIDTNFELLQQFMNEIAAPQWAVTLIKIVGAVITVVKLNSAIQAGRRKSRSRKNIPSE